MMAILAMGIYEHNAALPLNSKLLYCLLIFQLNLLSCKVVSSVSLDAIQDAVNGW